MWDDAGMADHVEIVRSGDEYIVYVGGSNDAYLRTTVIDDAFLIAEGLMRRGDDRRRSAST